MIKHLNNDFETVEYEEKNYILLYDNVDNEEYPLHWHNEIELIMPLKNNYIIEMREKKYDVKENEIIIIPSGELHHIYAMEGRRLIIQFDDSILGKHPLFAPVMRSVSAPLLISQEYDAELHSIARKGILDIFELYYSDSELAEIRIYEIFINMLVRLRDFQLKKQFDLIEDNHDRVNEYSKMFDKVFRYIDKNYMYDITLELLADFSGYSKYHFSRIFKQYSTVSYIDYLNEKRIKEAENMLLNDDISITEIAGRSGFKSLATFNRAFRKLKHCTPSEFKRLHQD